MTEWFELLIVPVNEIAIFYPETTDPKSYFLGNICNLSEVKHK